MTKSIGSQVFEGRKAAGLTQGELLKKMGLHPSRKSWISRIENGNIRSLEAKSIKRLEDALGIKIEIHEKRTAIKGDLMESLGAIQKLIDHINEADKAGKLILIDPKTGQVQYIDQ